MPSPLITVGITCFNAEDTIARALNSARAQDWERLDVLVVDDCSTDRSPRVVEEIAATDARVRLFRHRENLGPGAARQTILDHAHGEFVVFFDDDDESAPNRVGVQYRRLADYRRDQGALVACYASGERVYRNGYRMPIDAIGAAERVPVGHLVTDYLLFNRRVPGVCYGAGTPACALMAGVDTLRAAGGFDAEFRRVEDVDFACRLAALGGHFIGCPERLYTQHATQSPDKSAERNYRAEILLLDKNRAYLESQRRYGFARNWFTVRYHHFNRDRARMLAALVRGWLRNPVLVTRQVFTAAPARFRHERRMSRVVR